jgi:hypothetical protein
MSLCKHGNTAPGQLLDDLHEGQERLQRHKCTECAFAAGWNYGQTQTMVPAGNAECTYTGKRAPDDTIDALPESQAGKGRHKCAVCAYHMGFEAARAADIAKKIAEDVSKTVSDGLAKQTGNPN